MAEVEDGALLGCEVNEVAVEINPRNGVVALRIVLAIALKDNLPAIGHMDDAPSHPSRQFSEDVLIDSASHGLDGAQAAAGHGQIDGSPGGRNRPNVLVALEYVHLEALPQQHHRTERAYQARPHHDEVLAIARDGQNLCLSKLRGLVGGLGRPGLPSFLSSCALSGCVCQVLDSHGWQRKSGQQNQLPVSPMNVKKLRPKTTEAK
mmetsp:Transcript_68184/g.197670  ORF Transcript_68184/g.197670 Transcript_68184/m.197670 type:complete len:206 (-) Transcript_68184:7-624(-)